MRMMASLLLPALIAGCAGGATSSARYTGPAPACGRIEGGGVTATLTRTGETFALAPYEGSLVIEGRVTSDGAFSGSLKLRPAQAPSEGTPAKPPPRAPQQATATGRLAGDTATVAYAAPGCSASLTLSKVHPPIF